MSAPSLLVERDAGIARVTLNRPERLNAIDATLATDLLAAAHALGADPHVRAVVLRAAGTAFCAGADLSPGALPIDPSLSRGRNTRLLLERYFNPVALAWTRLPKPVVVAVNGIAAGGGVGLALTGDFLLMAESASLVQVFVPKLGLVPDMGCSFALARALGPQRARMLAMLGTPIRAADAVAWGLAAKCVPDADLAAECEAFARRLADGPTLAHAAVKELYAGPGDSLEAQLAREAELQERLGDSRDHAEGVAAFASKRAPAFRGE